MQDAMYMCDDEKFISKKLLPQFLVSNHEKFELPQFRRRHVGWDTHRCDGRSVDDLIDNDNAIDSKLST